MELKYLFTVCYLDGSLFMQDQKDKSTTREGGSAFTDVDQEKVVWMRLDGDGHSVAVDLRDGHFEVDGLQFWSGDDHQKFMPETKLRLVYFRRHRHDFTADGEETNHEVTYYIGWQTTINGKNYQQTIGLI